MSQPTVSLIAMAIGAIVSGLVAAAVIPTAAAQAADEAKPLDRATRILETARATLESERGNLAQDHADPATSLQHREARLRTGRLTEALQKEAVELLATGSPEEFAQALDILYRLAETDAIRRVWSRELDTESPLLRRCRYEWLFFTDDLAGVRTLVDQRGNGNLDTVDLLAAGRLDASTFELERARGHYESALTAIKTRSADSGKPPDRVRPEDRRLRAQAHAGLGEVAYRERDFEGALDHVANALDIDPLDPDFLHQLALVLIRHGRTDDAISAAELAVDIAPFHERAHYLLGNGYARKNYTQLRSVYPDAFASTNATGSSGVYMEADDAAKRGDSRRARELLLRLHHEHPQWIEVMARLGSMDYMEGRHDAAIDWFRRALETCPEYGRAHNGLAKAIEAKRLAVEVHRSHYESEFSEREIPTIPMIETFVLNWDALHPRHQKQVALSVEPWARFIPAIVAGGSTYYIKPLHELLSETPGQHSLRDQRISYDSRLWDDVRGCGGYHTVTGIEDVERTVLGRYNTVLHELTHQVHGILPADRRRQIEDLYQDTKQRDRDLDGTGSNAFLSRYAGGSVWEYFAEGANALASPRRDAFDTREIVRERLLDMDPALTDLVRDLMTEADIDSCYPIAYVNRGYRQLEDAKVHEALESCRLALDHDAENESALGALVYILQLADSTQSAQEWARRALQLHPRSASIVTSHATARWHDGDPLEEITSELASLRDQVRESDLRDVDQELGRLYGILGNVDASLAAYDRALQAQADSPAALWGRAQALAAAGRFSEAWEVYDEAVRARTGIIELRCDFAADLLEAGDVERAIPQVNEAVLLDPDDPLVSSMVAWLALEQGDVQTALEKSKTSVETGPWLGIAWWVRARVLQAHGDRDGAREALREVKVRIDTDAAPTYVFREKWGRYDEAWTLPARLREKTARLWSVLESSQEG